MISSQGVYQSERNGVIYYRSSITYKGKHIGLGSFLECSDAENAYIYARKLLNSDAAIADYTKDAPISFEKHVILVNFRDNGMYFKTPIYIKKKFFFYYINNDLYFTFDVDDLFYYSTHKIMMRGNYLFVSDFGMQINILSRYGIKNYAVAGRDYRFVNGDCNDMRYKNIEIINKYYGVTEHVKNGRTFYKTRIHVNGNYIVGTYPTEIAAAIAYNKAADHLKSLGLAKNFPQNYIESISAIEYARIYSATRISKKIREL